MNQPIGDYTFDRYEPVFFDIETTGLNPMAQDWWDNETHGARVTAIGIGTMNGWREGRDFEDIQTDVKILTDESEYRLLSVAHERLVDLYTKLAEDGAEGFLVGHNSRQFDHPYLGARYARLRLDGSLWNHNMKRLDTMLALGKHYGAVSRYPSEDDVLEALGIESDDPYDGSDMPQAYADRDWSMIQDHVKYDVAEMMEMFAEVPEPCMTEFYDHYDIGKDASFTEEVEY
mgnify:CR=1 FL=1